MKTIEVKASSIDDAIAQGLLELGVEKEQTEIEVLSKGGLFSKALVRITVKQTKKDKAEEFVKNILEKIGLNCEVSATEDGDEIKISIAGDDSGGAIGYRGETLDALQYLTLLVANQLEGDFKKVVLNAENYRAKREETLISLAHKLAAKAAKSGRKVVLEPMNPFERRIIHTALADNYMATTASEGEEPYRYVVILPKRQNRYDNNRGGYDNRGGGRYDNRARGGYNQNRGYGGGGGRAYGDRDNRGGYDNRGGSSDGNRGSYDNNNRGNYENRGGYSNRGGYGGYDNRDSGYESKNYGAPTEDTETVTPVAPEGEDGANNPAKKSALPKFKSFGYNKKRF